MNVFVLSTGRSGSLTFARACRFIHNYTAGHETDPACTLSYPDQHIEVDNRLSWFLGRLAEAYPGAYYVHLLRERGQVVSSFARRGAQHRTRLLHGFMFAIKRRRSTDLAHEAGELVDTVNANIRAFLNDRRHATIRIEDPTEPFIRMWNDIGAEGDLRAALKALEERHNRGPA